MANTTIPSELLADDSVTLDKMAGLARGKIIYGDASGNPAALALGTNGQVLKSDGTDIAWATDAAGTITGVTNFTDNRVITSSGSTTLNGEANLTFDGSTLDVTGVITTDGLTTSADINFGDNDKAVFGDGSDLQIYHDGSNSYVADTGTGVLNIQSNGTQINLQKPDGSKMIEAINNGNVVLYSNGTERLRVNGTGIDVTGEVQADTLDIDGTADISSTLSTGNILNVRQAGTGDATIKLGITRAGDGNSYLDFISDATNPYSFRVIRTPGVNGAVNLQQAGTGDFRIKTNDAADIVFQTNNTEKVRLDTSGNLGINTTAPATLLHIKADSNSATDFPLTIENAANSLDLGIGAYGLSNKVGTSQTSDFTMTIGDDLYLAADTVRLPDGADLIVQENDSTSNAVRLASDGNEGFLQVYRDGVQKVQIRGDGNN